MNVQEKHKKIYTALYWSLHNIFIGEYLGQTSGKKDVNDCVQKLF